MNIEALTQTLQFIAWFIALVELIVAIIQFGAQYLAHCEPAYQCIFIIDCSKYLCIGGADWGSQRSRCYHPNHHHWCHVNCHTIRSVGSGHRTLKTRMAAYQDAMAGTNGLLICYYCQRHSPRSTWHLEPDYSIPGSIQRPIPVVSWQPQNSCKALSRCPYA